MYPTIYSTDCGNLYFHQMHFTQRGQCIPTAAHAYGRVLRLLRGRLRVSADGVETEVGDNEFFDVPAGVAHGLKALEDDTLAQCVHVMRFPDGSVVPFEYKLTPRERLEITGAL